MPVTIKSNKVGDLKRFNKRFAKKSGGGGTYPTRIPKDGYLSVHFLEEPTEWYEFAQYYNQAESKFEIATEENEEKYEELGIRASVRFLANAINTETQEVIAVELPLTIVKTLVAFYERKGSLLEYNFDLSREGTGRDTEYQANSDGKELIDLDRFKKKDLHAIILAMANKDSEEEVSADIEDDDDDDEDEAPARPARKRVVKKIKRG